MSDKEKSIVINISGENAVVTINTNKPDLGFACLGDLVEDEQAPADAPVMTPFSSTGSPGRG